MNHTSKNNETIDLMNMNKVEDLQIELTRRFNSEKQMMYDLADANINSY